MKICLITGSAGLIGSEAVKYFCKKFDQVIGIDNDHRGSLFGAQASTANMAKELQSKIKNYHHFNIDIRDKARLNNIFSDNGADIKLIIHTAAQPSHDWAAKSPHTDFDINAQGTLNLLEATREYCKEAVFIFTSTNKVYGDRPNNLLLTELPTRYEILLDQHLSTANYNGINESMPIDQCLHSLFGVSKLSADLLVQEYGKYFDMRTGVFRGGCLTGPNHAGTEAHGFLSYLMLCATKKIPYTINGFKGKQVRDNIHSFDLIKMFDLYYESPKFGEVYNVGGSRHSNCSVLEAISLIEKITEWPMKYSYSPLTRKGDHQWYISDIAKFLNDYPSFRYSYTLSDTLNEMYK